MSDVSSVNPQRSLAATPPTPASPKATSTDQLGADTFLQLLVAQLKYQDPTSPAEGTEFLAQTAQFTMVEKLTQLAESSEAQSVVSRNLGAATMVGKSITWLQDDGTVGKGIVDSAQLGSSGPILMVDGKAVPFDTVASVAETPAAPQAAASTA